MAKDQVKSRVPYADKAESAQRIADAAQTGGARAAGEEAAGQGGAALARAGATALTGGASDAAGAAAPKINQAVDKIGEVTGKALFRGVAAVTSAAGVLVIALVILVGGTVTSLVASMSGNTAPPPPTPEQCATMPDQWCDILYQAQATTHATNVPVPWTVLAGLARVTTDFARTSPYDYVDRDPERPTPAWIAENFSTADFAGSATLGTVPYNSGSLAWGGHQNGRIPSSALCTVSFAPNEQLECTAAAALEELNEAYKRDHDGASLRLNDAYRSYEGQVYQRNRWCGRGSCGNAARPGTSNHGWGRAVDLANFGGIGDYSAPAYQWMVSNGPTYGWHHPEYMGPGGRGPLEPWHWEFRGHLNVTVTTATASTTTPPSVVTTAHTHQGLTAGTSAWGGTQCAVPTPAPAIGGQGREASGPFLLLPAAATELRAEGRDPQNPCDAAQFVAQKLAQAAAESTGELGYPEPGNQEAAATFWQEVLTRARVVADPTTTSGECTVLSDSTPVDQMIEEIWSCELAQTPHLFVISGAGTTSTGNVQFTEYPRDLAESTLITEAKAVAWAYSRYGDTECVETTPTAGVFPLGPADGAVSRCDPEENIRAAAKLVISGAAVPVNERDTTTGPFAPMVGGWAKMPSALGPDAARFPVSGPKVTWAPSDQCTQALSQHVLTAAGADSPFTDLADVTTRPTDTTVWQDYLGTWPQDVNTLCDLATSAEKAATAAAIIQGHMTDQAGVVVTRPADTEVIEPDLAPGYTDPDTDDPTTGEPAPEPTPPTTSDEPASDTSVWDLIEELGAEPASYTPTTHTTLTRVLPADTPPSDPRALLGLATWFTWQAQDAPTQDPATYGEQSVVARLSTTGNPVTPGPLSTSATTFAAAPWQQRVTEWAVFYGGTTHPFDTHGQRTGTLISSLSGIAGEYAAISGDTQSQARTVIEAAKKYLGTPYSWAGGGKNGPSKGTTGIVGFDCSGLTEYAFAQAGYSIGGWTGVQKDQGTAVGSLADAQPGDLLFFGSPIRHVAIYLGDNQLIHAPKPGDVVKIAPVYETPTLIKRVLVPREVTGDVDTWVRSALDVLYTNGFPRNATDTQDLLTIIQHESSGNPAAVNKSDSNWVAGHPSFGLMQTIPSTFDAHALDGYTNKSDPVAQIIAGARYAQSRYGALQAVPGLVALRNGNPYVGY